MQGSFFMPCFEKYQRPRDLKTEGLKDMSGGRLILKKRVIVKIYIFAGEYAKDRIFWGERSDLLG